MELQGEQILLSSSVGLFTARDPQNALFSPQSCRGGAVERGECGNLGNLLLKTARALCMLAGLACPPQGNLSAGC